MDGKRLLNACCIAAILGFSLMAFAALVSIPIESTFYSKTAIGIGIFAAAAVAYELYYAYQHRKQLKDYIQ